jgi:hypothetical protein
MLNIALRRIQGDRVVLEGKDFDKLVQRAKTVEDVVIEEMDSDVPVEGLMKLVEQDKAFAFLNDPAEDVYTEEDLKERYR